MADDIVTRLRRDFGTHHHVSETDRKMVAAAADEIERLRAELLDWERTVRAHEAENDELHNDLTRLLREVGRLRAAGDALTKQITKPCRCVEAHDGAINETCAPCAACFDWEEARRG